MIRRTRSTPACHRRRSPSRLDGSRHAREMGWVHETKCRWGGPSEAGPPAVGPDPCGPPPGGGLYARVHTGGRARAPAYGCRSAPEPGTLCPRSGRMSDPGGTRARGRAAGEEPPGRRLWPHRRRHGRGHRLTQGRRQAAGLPGAARPRRRAHARSAARLVRPDAAHVCAVGARKLGPGCQPGARLYGGPGVPGALVSRPSHRLCQPSRYGGETGRMDGSDLVYAAAIMGFQEYLLEHVR
jgi:hypothetical protein